MKILILGSSGLVGSNVLDRALVHPSITHVIAATRKPLPYLPLAFARLAHRHGAERFALVSAIGADASSSFFYPKTKGEVERDIKLVGFRSLTILRPSIIGR